MKKLLPIAVVFLIAFSAVTACAGEFSELKKKINVARASYLTLLNHPDIRGADQQKLVKDTADAVSAAISHMKPPAGKEAEFKQLVYIWNAFKQVREDDLVPLTLAGKQAEAEKISSGMQQQRVELMNKLCDSLDD